VFRTLRVLEEISETLRQMRGESADGFAGMRRENAEGFAGMRGELAEMRRESQQGSADVRGSIHNLQQVNREILLELRDHRDILGRIDHGVQANTEGLMHVLDELRNGGSGPGTLPAG
jgi:hypothetical protein